MNTHVTNEMGESPLEETPETPIVQPTRKSRAGSIALRLLAMVALVLVLFFLLRTFVFSAYAIPSGSMEDTIMPGDMVFSEKISYYIGDPQPGDIVTFADPLKPGRTLIKRVIATEGQTVELIDGQVVVDGVPLDEPYTDGLPSFPLRPSPQVEISYPYTLGEDELWVMGDNRTNSQDSRYFGPIDESDVTGKAFIIYWPLSSFGLLTDQ